MIHVINGLHAISGAETALLRIAAQQRVRPLTIVSLARVSLHPAIAQLPHDVKLIALDSRFGMVGSLFRLAALLSSSPAGTIISWMYRANVISAIALLLSRRKHKLIWNIRHSLSELYKESSRVRLSIYLNRVLRRVPAKIVYASDRSRVQHEEYGFPASKSLYIPNGFGSDSRAATTRIAEHAVVGHAGRLTWEKDPNTLLAAFSIVCKQFDRKVTLFMAGPGYVHGQPAFDDLLARYDIPEGSVQGLGPLSDMSEFYASLDVFVLSSVSEGFPNVLAEALLAEVPCVSTDVGDSSLIVSKQSGWIVPPSDPGELARAMVDALLLSSNERNAMGRIGRYQTLRCFSLHEIAGRYDALGRA